MGGENNAPAPGLQVSEEADWVLVDSAAEVVAPANPGEDTPDAAPAAKQQELLVLSASSASSTLSSSAASEDEEESDDEPDIAPPPRTAAAATETAVPAAAPAATPAPTPAPLPSAKATPVVQRPAALRQRLRERRDLAAPPAPARTDPAPQPTHARPGLHQPPPQPASRDTASREARRLVIVAVVAATFAYAILHQEPVVGPAIERAATPPRSALSFPEHPRCMPCPSWAACDRVCPIEIKATLIDVTTAIKRCKSKGLHLVTGSAASVDSLVGALPRGMSGFFLNAEDEGCYEVRNGNHRIHKKCQMHGFVFCADKYPNHDYGYLRDENHKQQLRDELKEQRQQQRRVPEEKFDSTYSRNFRGDAETKAEPDTETAAHPSAESNQRPQQRQRQQQQSSTAATRRRDGALVDSDSAAARGQRCGASNDCPTDEHKAKKAKKQAKQQKKQKKQEKQKKKQEKKLKKQQEQQQKDKNKSRETKDDKHDRGEGKGKRRVIKKVKEAANSAFQFVKGKVKDALAYGQDAMDDML